MIINIFLRIYTQNTLHEKYWDYRVFNWEYKSAAQILKDVTEELTCQTSRTLTQIVTHSIKEAINFISKTCVLQSSKSGALYTL